MKSSDTFSSLPGKGSPSWFSPLPRDLKDIGAKTDLILYAHLNNSFGDGSTTWHTMLFVPGSVVYDASPDVLWFVQARVHHMLYLWPAEVAMFGKVQFFFSYRRGPMTLQRKVTVTNMDHWHVVPTRAASPAKMFIMNHQNSAIDYICNILKFSELSKYRIMNSK